MAPPAVPTAKKPGPTLLTLPRELRDHIYELTFTERVDIIRHSATSREHGRDNTGILAVCKQIRSEALHAYYKHTVFSPVDVAAFALWAKRIKPQHRGLIRSIHLHKACTANNRRKPEMLGHLRQVPAYCGFAHNALKTRFYSKDGVLVWAAELPTEWPDAEPRACRHG